MKTDENPFAPGAGSPPPELVGRDSVLDEAKTLLSRVKLGRPQKSMLLTGLRGVGKTVLLNEIVRIAEEKEYCTILTEAHEGKTLGHLLAPHLRTLLYQLNRRQNAGNKVRRGLAVLRSFIGAIKVKMHDVELGLDIEPEKGTADSGDLEVDLSALFVAVAEAAQERNTLVALLIDEIQYFSSEELSALIMAMHRIQQRQLPLILVGAGLPVLPGMAGESKSYAERLLSFPAIGALSEKECARALSDPALVAGVRFDKAALHEIYRLTRGYPYFVQEWGYQAWNLATTSPISLKTIRSATKEVIRRLDENFFRVRYNRLTPGEQHFLRAMAELGPDAQRTGEIADKLGVKVTSLGPVRAKLINKGMIYSPAHGDLAFTVPLFDEFMRRAIPHFRQ